MNQDTLHEIEKRPINVVRNEAASITCQNNVFVTHSAAGLNFFEFQYNLRSCIKCLDIIEVYTSTHETSPVRDLFNSEFFAKGISNFDMNKLLLDSAYWPFSDKIVQELTRIVDCQWSPDGFLSHGKHAVAVINNLGSVQLLGPSRHTWINLNDLSSNIYQLITESTEYSALFKSTIDNMDSLQEAVSILVTNSICWGPILDDGQSYFVTAQKNGTILIWKLKCTEIEVISEIAYQLKTEIGEISCIGWLNQNETKFYLICFNIVGQVHVVHFEKENASINYIKTDCVWNDKDKMISQLLEHILYENKIILLYNKNRHLIVQVFDENFTLILQKAMNLNDYKLTGITQSNGDIYISTINCKIFRINLNVGNEIDIKLNPIKLKDTHYPQYDLNGISFSKNNFICALSITNKSVSYKKKLDVIEIVFTSWDLDSFEEVNFLLNNPSKSLTDTWDCIKLLQFKVMKSKTLPLIDYKALYKEAEQDAYKLKVYLILITMYNNIEKTLKFSMKDQLPETSEELIKERLFAWQAQSIIKDLWQLHISGQILNKEQIKYVSGAKNYLQYYCKKYKEDVVKFIANNVFMKEKFDCICQCCDEKINGLFCKHGHKNIFCSLTFSLIQSDVYLKCKACGLLAQVELFKSKPKCVICDLYLDKYFIEIE